MAPESALGWPAAGALVAGALRRRLAVAFAAASALGLAALLVLLVAAPDQLSPRLGLGLGLPAAPRAVLLVTAVSLASILGLTSRRPDRLALLSAGLTGLAGLAALALAPDPLLLAMVLALLGAGHASLPGPRPFVERLRGPAVAALLLGLGAVLARSSGATPPRLAAVALALGLAAALGIFPFMPDLKAEEPAVASAIAWTGYLGPGLALALAARIEPLLLPGSASVFGAVTIGLGLINLFLGVLGAWAAATDTAAWRYSFAADWGLALVGLGLLLPEGAGGAYLVLVSILLVRLPLYLVAQPTLRGEEERRLGITNLLLAALLAGAAPFAGFAARVLLLRAASELYWPLAAVLALGMLAWLPHSFRLARTLGRRRGRAMAALVIALLLSAAIGIFPAPLLSAAAL